MRQDVQTGEAGYIRRRGEESKIGETEILLSCLKSHVTRLVSLFVVSFVLLYSGDDVFRRRETDKFVPCCMFFPVAKMN